ncbi:MAG: hypothetical protein FWG66_10015 [Spirochaetes bacterium]|nr:hypothetical protein [Spirochaetota bacterium]
MSGSTISVHDNEIHSYKMLLPRRVLLVETSHKSEKTQIRFEDVLAYSFGDAGEQNIIFDIEEPGIEHFIDWYRSNRETYKQFEYSYPINGITDPAALLEFLTAEGYKYWELHAAAGLGGFVIAKNMAIEPL